MSHCISENGFTSNDVNILVCYCLNILPFNDAACKSNTVQQRKNKNLAASSCSFIEFLLKVVCRNLFSRFFTLCIKTTYFYNLKYVSYITVKVHWGSCWTVQLALRKSFELFLWCFVIWIYTQILVFGWGFLVGLCLASSPNSPRGVYYFVWLCFGMFSNLIIG